MNFCKICVLPDTRPNLVIGEDRICNACKIHNKNFQINWKKREKEFLKIIKKFKTTNNYDCLIPVSGGKDSTWQVLKLLKYGLKPLAITYKTPGRTKIGEQNLKNLKNLGVDHIDFEVNPRVESEFMLQTLKRKGSTSIPMHFAIYNMPLSIAINLSIPLIIYGENSAKEYGGKEKDSNKKLVDVDWFSKYGATNSTNLNFWYSKKLKKKDLIIYQRPSEKILKKNKITPLFLGYFFKYDPIETYKTAKKYGFKNFQNSKKTGLYDFADIDCDFISIHHWLKWNKFGFSRLMDNLSIEIRNKRISRHEALKIIKKTGNKLPIKDIKKFCSFTEISLNQFFKISEKFRNKKIWKKKGNKWFIPDFIEPKFFR
tara:strand:+ start:6596 stop:7708 length:1113 start_codon:yes stop_codon:yes gene_type:complete